jgi:alkane 1-monooxygenase
MRRWLPVFFAASPALGAWIGMPWLTLLLSAVALPVAEWTMRNAAGCVQRQRTWGTWHVRGVMLLVLLQSVWLSWAATQSDGVTLLWLALSAGYVAGGSGIVLAHELGHRRHVADRGLARVLLTLIGFGHYAIEHNRGHHRQAATWDDPATARSCESLWQFLPRYYTGVWINAVRLSREKPRRGSTLRLNEALGLLATSVLMWSLLTWCFGLQALPFLVLQAVVAQWLVGAVDYIEHWGLQRKRSDARAEPLGAQHIWDCNNPVSNTMLFNLPLHSAHHLEPWRTCDELHPVPESPQMPTGYAGMVLIASFPPLFRRLVAPRLPT